MKLLGETLFLLLAFLDLEFTKRRLAELGPAAELNPAIRWLISKTNIEWGTTIGIVAPTLALAGASWYSQPLLWFLVGFRTLLFMLQRSQNGN